MDDRSVTIAKITRPVLTGSFPRRRLFRRIDLALKRSSLWVCGPPGSGKTTLVSSYLANRSRPCLWLRLEEGDADPATFFHYLGLAAHKASPKTRRPLPVFTPDQQPAVSFFSRRFFEALFSRLRPGTVIVFDDYQQLPAQAVSHALIRDGIASLVPGVRFLLISRGQPPPSYARVRAGRSLEILGWRDLRLTSQETGGIARLRTRGKQPKMGVRSLQHACDGWAAGLVLLLEKSDAGETSSRKLPQRGTQEIFDYFASETLNSLNEEEQSFLLKTSLFPRMTADMAARLTGVARAGSILLQLNRGNLFTEVRRDAVPTYEYHPLFREFLRVRAAEAYPESRLRRLRARAAAILEASGLLDDAAELLQRIGDFQGLSRIVKRQGAALARQGRLGTLDDWLRLIPEGAVGKDPWLLYWRGVAGLPGRPGESRRDFEAAFRKFSNRKERDGAMLAWAGAVNAIVYGSGTLKDLDRWFALLEKSSGDGSTPLPEEVDSRVTGAMIKALSLRRPPFVNMEAWAERAARLADSTEDISTRFDCLLNVAYYRFHSGDFPATALLIEVLRELAPRPELSPLSRLNLYWLEAAYANTGGRHDHALKTVEDGLALADATGVHLMDSLLIGHGALSCLHKGKPGAARGFLRRMAASLATTRPWEAAFHHHLAAWVSLHDGEMAQAALHAERSLVLCEEVGNPWTEALAHLQKSFVLLENGRVLAAARSLERARRIGKRSGMQFVRFLCLVCDAYASLRRGDEASALAALRDGMRTGREHGYFDIYLWRTGVLEKVALKALALGIETGYVRELIRRNALVPEDPVGEPGHWPWPLKVSALGGFILRKDDGPLSFSRKAQRRPLMMLKALLALGGKDIPEDRLTDILWPEAEGDLAHQSFATTLGRLRALLGNDSALSLRGGRVTLEPNCCWVDAFAFEALVERIDRAQAGIGADRDGSQAASLARQAIALYKGPFLPEESFHPSIAAARERLRSKFLRVTGAVGRAMEREGRWTEAIAWYRQALEVDDLAEEFYQRLMISLAQAGQPAEAASVFRRCQRTLFDALGIAPSAETLDIAKELLAV